MFVETLHSSGTSPITAGHRYAVCVVEEDEALREFLCTLCESRGLAVEAYASTEMFMKAYDPRYARCLIFGIQSREQHGLDLLRRLKAEEISLPVILIGDNPETAMVVQAMKLGAADFFDKPFNTQALLHRILDLAAHGEIQGGGEDHSAI